MHLLDGQTLSDGLGGSIQLCLGEAVIAPGPALPCDCAPGICPLPQNPMLAFLSSRCITQLPSEIHAALIRKLQAILHINFDI